MGNFSCKIANRISLMNTDDLRLGITAEESQRVHFIKKKFCLSIRYVEQNFS